MDITHLHPMIIHFPIALLIIGFLSDLLGLITKKNFFTQSGFYLLLLGTIGVVAAYISGDATSDGITEAGALKQSLETHEEAAAIAVWVVSITAIFRLVLVLFKDYRGILRMLSLTLFLVSVLAIGRTGYYGGELVYKHAAGVQLNLGLNYNTIENDDD